MFRRKFRHRGFTLTEILIALAIIAYAIGGVIAGVVFSMRLTRLNTNAVIAKNITQSYFERMHSDIFANVNAVNYPNIEYNSMPPVWLDEALNIRCKVEFVFKGYGRAEAGTGSSLTDNDANWAVNEWAGARLYLVERNGVGQYRKIASNSPTMLVLEGAALQPRPTSGTAYMINNGKTVEIKTTWMYMGKEYTQSIRSLIVNHRNDGNLGF